MSNQNIAGEPKPEFEIHRGHNAYGQELVRISATLGDKRILSPIFIPKHPVGFLDSSDRALHQEILAWKESILPQLKNHGELTGRKLDLS